MKQTQPPKFIKIGEYGYLDFSLVKYILQDTDYSSKIKIYIGPESNPGNNWIRVDKCDFDKYCKQFFEISNIN